MEGAALQVVALTRELFGLDLLAEPALILKGPEPVIGEAHVIPVHPDYPGLLEHGQIAPADVARPRSVQDFGYLSQGEPPAGGVEGIDDGTADLAEALYAVSELGLGRLAHLAGAENESAFGRVLR